jgi:hypothetical protein
MPSDNFKFLRLKAAAAARLTAVVRTITMEVFADAAPALCAGNGTQTTSGHPA